MLEDGTRRGRVLAAVCAALLVIVVDNTLLSVALPSIAESFTASNGQLQAVVDAYVVVFAGLLLAGGVLADRHGRRRAVLVGLSVLGLASVAATAAGSVWWLITARAVMGVGAALVMPATLAVLVHVFPAEQRAKAFAAWAAVASVAMAAGPVLGGFLVATWSWAAVFLINVPLVAVALAGVVRFVPESRDPAARPLDPCSACLAAVGMSALACGLILTGERVGAGLVTCCFAVSAAGLIVLGRRELRAASPMIELRLYRDRRFAGASLAAGLLTLATGSVLFVLTQYLQLVQGRSALQAGIAMAPLAVGTVLGSVIGGRAPRRLGSGPSIGLGFAAAALAFVVLATLSPDSAYSVVAAGLFLAGAGTGFAGPAVNSTVLGAVPPDRAGMGSALNDTHQQLGVALGIAALGSLLTVTYRAGLPPEVAARGSLAETLAARPDLAGTAAEAFVRAQSVTMLAAAVSTAAGALVASLLVRNVAAPADGAGDGEDRLEYS